MASADQEERPNAQSGRLPDAGGGGASAPCGGEATVPLSALLATLDALPREDQTAVLHYLTARLRPDSVVSQIRGYLSTGAVLSVMELRVLLPDVPVKQVYNALGSLTRRRKVQRAGYGRYELVS